MLLTATHTHSAGGQEGPGYARKIVESVRLAKQQLVPARVGYGTGVSFINVNRNIIDPKTHRWWEGPNHEGPPTRPWRSSRSRRRRRADRRLLQLRGPRGRCGPARSGQRRHTRGRVAYIEEAFGDAVVALWSTGAAGDQNPIYFQQTYDLREIRIKDYAKRGVDISNAMPPGGQGLNRSDPVWRG